MRLLEREGPLAALADAFAQAAQGDGSVVLVSGEPGIGKTALVTRFLDDLPGGGRVLAGTCDDLAIPRPLGPFRDLAGSVSAPLAEALSGGAAPHDIHRLLLSELERPPPVVMVLEDVHWADDATLDAITVLGRRIGSLTALLVLTYRAGEAGSLLPVIDAIRASSLFLELAPLSEQAVASLAGEDAAEVYAATGGNPFYVSELLAARPAGDLPLSIASAVLGRASRLDEPARSLLNLVSVVPSRVPTRVLDTVLPGWPAAAEEPERRQLLEVAPTDVRFRHELARQAIESSLPVAVRRRLHAEILEALLAAETDPADVVHHAEAAGATDVVADYALAAARQAAALESNREAYAHYRRAAELADRLPAAERPLVLEELAHAAYLVGRLDDALAAIERASALYREAGDEAGVGRCRRRASRLLWFAGEGAPARAAATEAIAILEPLGESVELARAYSGLSQLAMLAQDVDDARRWAERALELAARLGDDQTRSHAQVNLGTVRLLLDPGDTAGLLEAHAFADAVGNRYDAARALVNLGGILLYWIRPLPAEDHARRALAYAREHEVHNLASYAATVVAWLRLRAGAWDEAGRAAQAEIDKGVTVTQLLAKTLLADLAVRRGDPDASERLADATAQADPTGDPQQITPVLELAIERALIGNEPVPRERILRLADEWRSRSSFAGGGVRLAAWAAVAGLDLGFVGASPAPFGAMLARDWRAAADAFGDVGWSYDRALMLSLLDGREALAEALETARGLGAEPLRRRVVGRMRSLGLAVPRGPRGTTLANPAGLTARQLEVLALLAAGLTNAEIAERLVVSQRTAEHHVAAVLAKLGVATRRQAARRAAELGLA